MSIYYVDTAGSNTSPYDTWSKAATDMQTIELISSSGDTVFCRGSQTLTTAITITTDASATGEISWVGCNAEGEDDGTFFVLDGNSVSTNCLYANGGLYHRFKNFRCTGATSDGVGGGTTVYAIFEHCKFDNNGGSGFDAAKFDHSHFFMCAFVDNGGYGLKSSYSGFCFAEMCKIIGNSSHGVYSYVNASYSACIEGCVIADNGGSGINAQYGGLIVKGNTIDANTESGVFVSRGACTRGVFIVGNRITNNGLYGLDDILVTSEMLRGVTAYNFIYGNTSGEVINSGSWGELSQNSVDTNIYTGTIGYNSPGSPDYDYNLTADATMRDVAITLPE